MIKDGCGCNKKNIMEPVITDGKKKVKLQKKWSDGDCSGYTTLPPLQDGKKKRRKSKKRSKKRKSSKRRSRSKKH